LAVPVAAIAALLLLLLRSRLDFVPMVINRRPTTSPCDCSRNNHIASAAENLAPKGGGVFSFGVFASLTGLTVNEYLKHFEVLKY
jgi:hypothetical protein